METVKLSDDELGQILRRVRSRADCTVCSQVCKQWRRVEGLTRTSLRVLDPQLMHLYLHHFSNILALEAMMQLCDSDLACIAENCRSLEILNMNQTKGKRQVDIDWYNSNRDLIPVGDEGIEAIARNCKNLRHVGLRWRQGVGDRGVCALADSCLSVTHLDLAHCKRITDRSIGAVCQIPALQVLVLRSCSLVTDLSLSILASGATAKTLRRLDLSECDQITDSGVVFLRDLVALQNLNLAECGPRITDVGGLAISVIPSLQVLNISWLINLSDLSILAVAQNCSGLREMNLSGCELVTGVGLRAFSEHGALRALVLASCSNVLGDDVDSTATSCSALEYVGLDRGLRPWMSNDCLERLQVRCQIEWF